MLYALGFCPDADGTSDFQDTLMDEPCVCKCGRCPCVQFDITGVGSSGCGALDYDKTVTPSAISSKRTTAQITAFLKKVSSFNPGKLI